MKSELWMDIGSSPPGEACAQVGSDGYWEQARRECHAYVRVLRRALGPEPQGARLAVRSSPHDFGPYLSVVCYYDGSRQDAVEYAFGCESRGPLNWDAEARRELGLEAS